MTQCCTNSPIQALQALFHIKQLFIKKQKKMYHCEVPSAASDANLWPGDLQVGKWTINLPGNRHRLAFCSSVGTELPTEYLRVKLGQPGLRAFFFAFQSSLTLQSEKNKPEAIKLGMPLLTKRSLSPGFRSMSGGRVYVGVCRGGYYTNLEAIS